MSYQYSSYKQTTTRDGYSTRTTTRTTTAGSGSSLVVRELTETEVSSPRLSSSSDYQISDEDRLTKYDFYSLMDSEDEANSETESESDVEYHWFPSLLRNSVIELLEDSDQENYMDEDVDGKKVLVIENEETSEEDQIDDTDNDDDDFEHVKRGGKRFNKYHPKKHVKKPKKSDIVPVEVVHVII
ncbi:hypothetical protein EDC94DRAFT_610268 [Helicostylum pulchrum]|nr:hypothetical protein EDC94DRAFT_610268 [Helicostylum pulchrum]